MFPSPGQQYLALSALEALNQSIDGGLASLPINIMICIEGEEEIGSPGKKYYPIVILPHIQR